MSGPVQQRPRQVTLAGWLTLVGSGLTILVTFDAVGRLHSQEVREAITSVLGDPSVDGLGLTVDAVRGMLRTAMLVAGAAAAAAVVLAGYVLRGHRGARVGLAVVAVPILLTAPFSGGPLGVVVAGSSLLLWSRPAREWFAGDPERSVRKVEIAVSERPEEPREETPDAGEQPPSGPPPYPGTYGGDDPAPSPAAEAPGAERPEAPGYPGPGPGQPGYGYPPPSPYGGYPPPGYPGQPGQPPYPGPQGYPGAQPYPGQAPYPGYPAYGGYPVPGQGPGQVPGQVPGQGAGRRPWTVATACWVTWVVSGLTAVGFVFAMVVLAVARDDVLRRINDQPMLQDSQVTPDQLIGVLWVVCALLLLWSLAAVVLAGFTWRGAAWARILLVVSAGVAGLPSLLSFPLGLIYLVVLVATIVLLFTGGANPWFAGRSPASGSGQAPRPQVW